MMWLTILSLIGAGLKVAEGFFNKSSTAGTVITDAELADQFTMAVLQKSAEVKGLTIDWTDPQQVLTYIQTLPDFVPLPPIGDANPQA